MKHAIVSAYLLGSSEFQLAHDAMTNLTHIHAAAHLAIRSHNDGNDDEHQRESGIREALAPEQVKIKPPPLYRVILLNDDYTPMEFVVEILRQFFGMNTETATRVMLKVHTEGKGVCGVFPKEIAETKATLVNEHARASEHPLMCDIEADD